MNEETNPIKISVPEGRIEHAMKALERDLQQGDPTLNEKRRLHDARESFQLYTEEVGPNIVVRESPDVEKGYRIACERFDEVTENWFEDRHYDEVPNEYEFVEALRDFVDTYSIHIEELEDKPNQVDQLKNIIDDYKIDYKGLDTPEDGNLF